MDLKTLNKDIKERNFSPVYFFTGIEKNLMNNYIETIKSKTIQPSLEGLNFLRFNDKDIDISEVVALCETLPVLSEKRIIVIDEQTNLLKNTDEDTLNTLTNYLKNPSPDTILFILSESPDKRRKLYKEIKKNSKLIEFKKLKLPEARSFINKLAKKQKITISPQATSHLIERLHYLENDNIDTLTIENELNRCIDYLGEDKDLTIDIIDEVIPESVEDNIFKIIDMIVNGKLQGVYDILDFFWQQGESPIGILSLLIYQLRNILKIKILLSKGYNPKQISEIGKISPFIVRKLTGVSKKFSLKRLYELFNEAAQLDLNMKTGALDHYLGLEYFLLKLNKVK